MQWLSTELTETHIFLLHLHAIHVGQRFKEISEKIDLISKKISLTLLQESFQHNCVSKKRASTHPSSHLIRSEGLIVLAVASSGITSLLLSGDRTAHSRFKIPLMVSEISSCEIKRHKPFTSLREDISNYMG
uniref:ATP-dependent DNA helicase n=1 Tax=Salix viminalis TaxID=40686 RepID=A0A6N2MZ70_SALVM